ncbi:MAG: Ig domain-containing protein [Patescibacteria group bacterium]
MTLPRRKTIVLFALSLALVAAAVFWGGPEVPSANAAQTAPALTNLKTALGEGALAGLGNGLSAFAFVTAVLLIVYGASTFFLGIVGSFLDTVFSWNVSWNPSTIPIVLDGWIAMRDVANGIFILIVLWIAIAIIFNLDNLGGRKLLVRVIVVALLINFSLLMVSAVFGFANMLAHPFYKALGLDLNNPKSSLSTVITAKTFIHETAKGIAGTQSDQLFKQQLEQQAQSHLDAQGSSFASLWRSVGGIQETQAALPIAAAAWIGLKWFGIAAAGAIANWLVTAGVTAGAVYAFWNQGMSLIVADVFLLALLSAFVTMTVLLLLRLAAMIFIAILAPIALISMVVPRYGEKFWNQWLSYLLNWAFMAPVFYFMTYIAVLFLDRFSVAIPGNGTNGTVGFGGNVYKMLALTMFLALLWTGIITARKMGGAIADTALTFGKKLAGVGLGLGAGFLARHALPGLGKMATKTLAGINRVPLLRTSIGRSYAPKALRGVAYASRQQILDAQKRMRESGMTNAEIQQGIASGEIRNKADIAGAMLHLQSQKALRPQPGVHGYNETHQLDAKRIFKELNLDAAGFQRANPLVTRPDDYTDADIQKEIGDVRAHQTMRDSATGDYVPREISSEEAAYRLAWKRTIRAGDMESMDLDSFRDDTKIKLADGREVTKGQLMQDMLLELGSNDHLTKLGRTNSIRAQEMQAHLESPEGQHVWDIMDERKKQYFRSNLAQELAFSTPHYARPSAGSATTLFRAINPQVGFAIQEGTTGYASTPLVTGGDGVYAATPRIGSLPPGLRIEEGRIVGNVDSTAVPGRTYTHNVSIADGTGAEVTVIINITITKK